MQNIFALIEKAAKVDLPVLIRGETGTGKELVAWEIHTRSARKEQPFVPINMGAIPPELLGSELFGHEKGSFTGAAGNRVGRFQEAQGGTLFLDEVLAMDDRVQISLLRVLESAKYRRVGGENDLDSDVRILAAVNEDPMKQVRQKRFRIDLLHRLQVLQINIPPLRQRKRDITILARHFLAEMSREYENVADGISSTALRMLSIYDWPGNIRELRNVLYHAAILAGRNDIQPEHLPDRVRPESEESSPTLVPSDSLPPQHPLPVGLPGMPPHVSPSDTALSDGIYIPLGLSLEEVEKAYILKTLSLVGNNKTRASERLGLSRKTLYTKLARWKISG